MSKKKINKKSIAPKYTKKDNTFYALLLTAFALFWTIGSVLGIVSCARTSSKSTALDVVTASADSYALDISSLDGGILDFHLPSGTTLVQMTFDGSDNSISTDIVEGDTDDAGQYVVLGYPYQVLSGYQYGSYYQIQYDLGSEVNPVDVKYLFWIGDKYYTNGDYWLCEDYDEIRILIPCYAFTPWVYNVDFMFMPDYEGPDTGVSDPDHTGGGDSGDTGGGDSGDTGGGDSGDTGGGDSGDTGGGDSGDTGGGDSGDTGGGDSGDTGGGDSGDTGGGDSGDTGGGDSGDTGGGDSVSRDVYELAVQNAYNEGKKAGLQEGIMSGSVVTKQQNEQDMQDSYYEGKKDGLQEALDDGSVVASDKCKANSNAAFNRGYLQGISEANDYTFIGLLSAVVDVPVQTFMGLFNFEILGVNIASFLLSLFTVCVILLVVKLIL